MVWQPGVLGTVGSASKPPPSMLYSTLKPATALTVGSVKADAHVLAGALITGAVGKITALLVTEVAQAEEALAAVLPHAAVSTYLV